MAVTMQKASIFRVEGKIRKSASEETVRTSTSRLVLENIFQHQSENGGNTFL
jgi:hypothetical protein